MTCEFCRTQIIVDEAIQKYKLEISGKVEVDGIKGRKEKMKEAQNAIKFQKWDKAIEILSEFNTFYIEALTYQIFALSGKMQRTTLL